MIVLKTDKLILREFKESDLNHYKLLRSSPEFQRYYSEEDAATEKSAYLLKLFISQASERPRFNYQLAIENAVGTLIGSCGIRIVSVEERQGSFGCEIAKEFWGQGFALEACQTIIDFGFKNLELHRIYAETISENNGAVALAKRLGMSVEGELRENRFFRDRWWDTVLLAILSSEWSHDTQPPNT